MKRYLASGLITSGWSGAMWCSISQHARASRRRGTARRRGCRRNPHIWILSTTFALSLLTLLRPNNCVGVVFAVPLIAVALLPPPPTQALHVQRRTFVSAALPGVFALRPVCPNLVPSLATDTQRPMYLPFLIGRHWVLVIALVAVCRPWIISLVRITLMECNPSAADILRAALALRYPLLLFP